MCSKTNVFATGEHHTMLVTPEEAFTPMPLLIYTPLEAGEYPLSHHIASHGFILVVPQLTVGNHRPKPHANQEVELVAENTHWLWKELRKFAFWEHMPKPDATQEVELVAEITNWLPEQLCKFLPSQVNANISLLGLAGHSRGGKVAFAFALKSDTKLLKYSALIGIDPVDGTEKGSQPPPQVLTYVPHSFNLKMPVMVIGSGLGEFSKPFLPPAAPEGVNHKDFYNECCKPACYFVAKDYGHLDMLDDKVNWREFMYYLVTTGESREPMRRFVGGAVVAFLKAYLGGDLSHLMGIKDDEFARKVLQKVEISL